MITILLRDVTLQTVPTVTQLFLRLKSNSHHFPHQYAMQFLWILACYLIYSRARHDRVQTRTRATEEVNTEVLFHYAWRVAT
jgi:hypothetical protein